MFISLASFPLYSLKAMILLDLSYLYTWLLKILFKSSFSYCSITLSITSYTLPISKPFGVIILVALPFLSYSYLVIAQIFLSLFSGEINLPSISSFFSTKFPALSYSK
ncbi:hypothetical protein [Clostridium estertheticum]|uniref:hypothetical protein n=1 Tax=Clostridium estertheticum TaxID=238834 RepID=UPI0027149A02|nr:hypothetical protein [Clostridium estertheticum]